MPVSDNHMKDLVRRALIESLTSREVTALLKETFKPIAEEVITRHVAIYEITDVSEFRANMEFVTQMRDAKRRFRDRMNTAIVTLIVTTIVAVFIAGIRVYFPSLPLPTIPMPSPLGGEHG